MVKIVATPVEIKGICRQGYKVGKPALEFEVREIEGSRVPCVEGRVCPEAFGGIYRNALALMYGAELPWAVGEGKSTVRTACPDWQNIVVFELKRVE